MRCCCAPCNSCASCWDHMHKTYKHSWAVDLWDGSPIRKPQGSAQSAFMMCLIIFVSDQAQAAIVSIICFLFKSMHPILRAAPCCSQWELPTSRLDLGACHADRRLRAESDHSRTGPGTTPTELLLGMCSPGDDCQWPPLTGTLPSARMPLLYQH